MRKAEMIMAEMMAVIHNDMKWMGSPPSEPQIEAVAWEVATGETVYAREFKVAEEVEGA